MVTETPETWIKPAWMTTSTHWKSTSLFSKTMCFKGLLRDWKNYYKTVSSGHFGSPAQWSSTSRNMGFEAGTCTTDRSVFKPCIWAPGLSSNLFLPMKLHVDSESWWQQIRIQVYATCHLWESNNEFWTLGFDWPGPGYCGNLRSKSVHV